VTTHKTALLTKKEAARFLNCSTRTVDRIRAEGLVQAIKLRGRRSKTLFRQSDLDQFLAKSRER
jgi:excisionase family DNA binding protein